METYLEVLFDGTPEALLLPAPLLLEQVQSGLGHQVLGGGATGGEGQVVSQGHLSKLCVGRYVYKRVLTQSILTNQFY